MPAVLRGLPDQHPQTIQHRRHQVPLRRPPLRRRIHSLRLADRLLPARLTPQRRPVKGKVPQEDREASKSQTPRGHIRDRQPVEVLQVRVDRLAVSVQLGDEASDSPGSIPAYASHAAVNAASWSG